MEVVKFHKSLAGQPGSKRRLSMERVEGAASCAKSIASWNEHQTCHGAGSSQRSYFMTWRLLNWDFHPALVPASTRSWIPSLRSIGRHSHKALARAQSVPRASSGRCLGILCYDDDGCRRMDGFAIRPRRWESGLIRISQKALRALAPCS